MSKKIRAEQLRRLINEPYKERADLIKAKELAKSDLKNGINQLRLFSLNRGLSEQDIINTLEEVIKDYLWEQIIK
jgi:hypothetical protein